MPDPRPRAAADLMTRFAERTGLAGSPRPGAPRRYLWTDAFAVCNFIGAWRAGGDPQQLELALRLVERVHATLGRFRDDDQRTGWLSGRDDADGERHPTIGGLRIGKPLPERRSDQPYDDRLEWDRDGQYFHYLTRWMHALDVVARATGRDLFATWARELAAAAHRAFVYSTATGRRMYWKMSSDLTRPLVPSMGHHDALDGYISCMELDERGLREPDLARATDDYASMIDHDRLATDDALGIGGLLVDAHRIVQLASHGALAIERGVPLLAGALAGLRSPAACSFVALPARNRLAFRELGLAIGLAAIDRIVADPAASGRLQPHLDRLADHAELRTMIESFWLAGENRDTAGYRGHADINDVMLATALAPAGYLELPAD